LFEISWTLFYKEWNNECIFQQKSVVI
jgi:hypothetical protein